MTFRVEAESTTCSGLSYQWQYTGAAGTSWHNFAGGMEESLAKTVRESWDGWKIRCVITDVSGNSRTSNTAVITVE